MSIYSTRYAAILMAIPLLAGTGAIANAASNGSMTANGSLEQSHGDWRSSKLVGSTVYNSQGDSVGTINDMLLDTNGQISKVSISVGGFLGVGSKMVEVPFSKLKFEPSKSNSNAGGGSDNAVSTVASGNANGQDYSVVLPDVSKDQLKSMTAFNY